MKTLLTILSLLLPIIGLAQPAYDDCNNAVNLGEAPICTDDVYTNIDATMSMISTLPGDNIPSCWSSVENDVWLMFTTPTDGSFLDFEITVAGVDNGPNSQSIFQPELAIYRGECVTDGLAELTCTNSGLGQTAVQMQVLALDPGAIYYLRINDVSASGTPNWGDFQVCVDSLGSCFQTTAASDYICAGQSVQLLTSNADDFSIFSWEPAGSLSDPNIAEPIASPTETTTYTLTAFEEGSNLIVNGDFEDGNTNFYTEYIHGPDTLPEGVWGTLSYEGTYQILDNPMSGHSNFFACGDHTTGTGNMMVINGSSTPDLPIWCQTVNVEPNTEYLFSAWLASVEVGNPAILQFSINGNLLDVPFGASSSTCNWLGFNAPWNSGSNFIAEICITNQNTSGGGNDFAIDDLAFFTYEPCIDTVLVSVSNPMVNVESTIDVTCTDCNGAATVSASGSLTGGYVFEWSDGQFGNMAEGLCVGDYTVTVTDNLACTGSTDLTFSSSSFELSVFPLNNSCVASTTGSAQVIIAGGSPPYTILWDNGENTEIATNLDDGPHDVTVTDSDGCQLFGSVFIMTNPDGLTVSIETTNPNICSGEITVLESTGNGIESYLWSTGEIASSITVLPTETTTYFLTATSNGSNLIFNGDFEQGDIGFTSDHTGTPYPTNGMCQGCYTVGLTPPLVWQNQCTDHTSGSGNHLVFNSATEAGFSGWCQTVNISANTDYIFNFWTQTVTNGATAELVVNINGDQLGENFDLGATCNWLEFTEEWNSGNTTSVEICINNLSLSGGGNDFSLDDISLVPICTSQDSITIQVSNPIADIGIVPPDCSGNNGEASVVVFGGIEPYTYAWEDGETTQTISIVDEGTYSVTITDAFDCTSTATDDLQIEELDIDIIEIIGTSCGENNGSFAINTMNATPPIQYNINDQGFTDSPNYFDLAAGIYDVVIQDANGCEVTDMVDIATSESLSISINAPDSLLCMESLDLSVGNFETYLWSDGSTDPIAIVTTAGEYMVTVTDADNCTATNNINIAECGSYEIPNAFTPNNDGNNDTFGVVAIGDISVLSFQIYNRWGELVHDSPNPWNGLQNGTAHPSDVLVYVIKIETPTGVEQVSGDVTLIR